MNYNDKKETKLWKNAIITLINVNYYCYLFDAVKI